MTEHLELNKKEAKKNVKGFNDVEKGRLIHLTKYDCHPIDFNRDTMLLWLKDCGWVDNYIRSKVTKGAPYLEDYLQEIWVYIIEKADRLVDIFNNEGKGKFTNFLKCLMNNNIISVSSKPYRLFRDYRVNYETYLNDDGWDAINDSYDGEGLYKGLKYPEDNPFDELDCLSNEKLINKLDEKGLYKKSTKTRRHKRI